MTIKISESKTDSSFKLNDESMKKNSSSLEESKVRLVRSP
ncbi:hypothetical protein DOY81_011150 [Sarcophaga bullata]|nr:hypothetical protein DOY81_011150 [Sarcophaga bullata]